MMGKNNIKKIFRIVLILLLIISIVGYLFLDYAINNYLAYSPIRPTRVALNGITPSKYNLRYKDFNIIVEDTITLKGWFVFIDTIKPKGTIFLLHGIGSNKVAMLENAKLLASNGFNCVLYDARASGESGGLNCTFGYYEKKDLSSFIDSTLARFPNSKPIGALGHSLGAAVIIQALEFDKRIDCAVVESPFADLRNIVYDYSERMYYVRINWIVDEALEKSESIADFKVDEVKPAQSAKNIFQPVMVVHGLKDDRISYKYGKEIFNKLKSSFKKWYPVPTAKHNDVSAIGGKTLDSIIVDYFNQFLN
jgi:uncharacterized protein